MQSFAVPKVFQVCVVMNRCEAVNPWSIPQTFESVRSTEEVFLNEAYVELFFKHTTEILKGCLQMCIYLPYRIVMSLKAYRL